jgi:hypothetical protein
MTQRRKPSVHVEVSAAEEAVVAEQPLEVTVRLSADRPLEISGAEVELDRDVTVTHSRRQ